MEKRGTTMDATLLRRIAVHPSSAGWETAAGAVLKHGDEKDREAIRANFKARSDGLAPIDRLRDGGKSRRAGRRSAGPGAQERLAPGLPAEPSAPARPRGAPAPEFVSLSLNLVNLLLKNDPEGIARRLRCR